MTGEQGERIARLEAKFEHMADSVEEMRKKVDELHALLMSARGAKWAVVAVASASGFIAGKLGGFASFFTVK